MSGRGQPFDPKVVLGLLLFGALAFLATLYFIGSGQTGGNANNGQAHAASNGITGYTGLAELLREAGHEVTVSRSPATLDDEALLIVTPPLYAEAEEVQELLENRRYQGPTILVLPKWQAMQVPPQQRKKAKAKEGWVVLSATVTPPWVGEMEDEYEIAAQTGYLEGGSYDWSGLGLEGRLPDRKQVMALTDGMVTPLVVDKDGDVMAGYLDDGGYYPVLDEAAGLTEQDEESLDSDKWAVVVVAEPDLLDNYGMADRTRAELAHELVDVAMEGQDLPIVFDLTMNGLGKTQNLLTLAFTPPFLAATLCLILAMIVAGWRAFLRFGPPLAEDRSIAFGKTRLVANSASFIQRTKRLHLLAEPYAAMMRSRIAAALGLARPDDAAIDEALARRHPDTPSYTARAAALRNAGSPGEILRAADALKSIERMLQK